MLVTITVQLPPDLLARLAVEARRDAMTVGDWLAEAGALRLEQRQPHTRRRPKMARCRWCDQYRVIRARGYCKACYERQYRATYTGTCQDCRRRHVVLRAHGLCGACYTRAWRRQRRHRGVCVDCQRERMIQAGDRCGTCYPKHLAARKQAS